jgi:hypothetical protein
VSTLGITHKVLPYLKHLYPCSILYLSEEWTNALLHHGLPLVWPVQARFELATMISKWSKWDPFLLEVQSFVTPSRNAKKRSRKE